MCYILVRCNELDPAILVLTGAIAVLIVVVPAGIAQVVVTEVEVHNAAHTIFKVIAQDLGGQLRNFDRTADTIAVYTAGNADLQCNVLARIYELLRQNQIDGLFFFVGSCSGGCCGSSDCSCCGGCGSFYRICINTDAAAVVNHVGLVDIHVVLIHELIVLQVYSNRLAVRTVVGNGLCAVRCPVQRELIVGAAGCRIGLLFQTSSLCDLNCIVCDFEVQTVYNSVIRNRFRNVLACPAIVDPALFLCHSLALQIILEAHGIFSATQRLCANQIVIFQLQNACSDLRNVQCELDAHGRCCILDLYLNSRVVVVCLTARLYIDIFQLYDNAQTLRRLFCSSCLSCLGSNRSCSSGCCGGSGGHIFCSGFLCCLRGSGCSSGRGVLLSRSCGSCGSGGCLFRSSRGDSLGCGGSDCLSGSRTSLRGSGGSFCCSRGGFLSRGCGNGIRIGVNNNRVDGVVVQTAPCAELQRAVILSLNDIGSCLVNIPGENGLGIIERVVYLLGLCPVFRIHTGGRAKLIGEVADGLVSREIDLNLDDLGCIGNAQILVPFPANHAFLRVDCLCLFQQVVEGVINRNDLLALYGSRSSRGCCFGRSSFCRSCGGFALCGRCGFCSGGGGNYRSCLLAGAGNRKGNFNAVLALSAQIIGLVSGPGILDIDTNGRAVIRFCLCTLTLGILCFRTINDNAVNVDLDVLVSIAVDVALQIQGLNGGVPLVVSVHLGHIVYRNGIGAICNYRNFIRLDTACNAADVSGKPYLTECVIVCCACHKRHCRCDQRTGQHGGCGHNSSSQRRYEFFHLHVSLVSFLFLFLVKVL